MLWPTLPDVFFFFFEVLGPQGKNPYSTLLNVPPFTTITDHGSELSSRPIQAVIHREVGTRYPRHITAADMTRDIR